MSTGAPAPFFARLAGRGAPAPTETETAASPPGVFSAVGDILWPDRDRAGNRPAPFAGLRRRGAEAAWSRRMFRIRRIFDTILPIDQQAIAAVQDILRQQFPGVRPEEITELPHKLQNPGRYGFRYMLFVAENGRGDIRGCALLSHEAELGFCYLDYIAAATWQTGGGVGGALYERVRAESGSLGVAGLFFECLPDDPEECPSPEALRQNRARLRFYEHFGARPIANTAYQLPVRPGQRGMPLLVYDGLDHRAPLRRDFARRVCRTILTRKYPYLCSPEYTREVVESFTDDPVRFRDFRYLRPDVAAARVDPTPAASPITLIVNDRHDIHHVRERGYVEAPVRVKSILAELEPTGLCRRVEPREYPETHIRAVHDSGFVTYFRRVCENQTPGRSLYPYVFPIRNAARPPKELAVRAGYYCIDTFTPLNSNAYVAAKRAVDCGLTGADALLRGNRLAYALVRPPGHHAEHRVFGGFCYFNNSAVAAHYLSRFGRVAILDIDYHHGNGQQDIFYERPDILTVSIHGHPSFAYPYFSGFAEETGAGTGTGFNLNLPLPEAVDGPAYLRALQRALGRIARFRPLFLIVALGLDTAKGDPTGSWSLSADDFEENGRLIGSLRRPTLVMQEGGYRTRTLGVNARRFMTGIAKALML